MRLENKSVLITGAGSGQGAAAAKLFASEGASVVVFDRDESGAKSVVEEITSKGGVISLTRAMAINYARQGVRVNVICPGGVDTPMLEPMLNMAGQEKVARSHPLGRLGTPLDIAQCSLFLASEESSWITGVTIPVDGGVTAA